MKSKELEVVNVREFFDARADAYHCVSRWAINEDLNSKSDDFLNLLSGQIALELGAGTGILISRLRNFKLKLALDISQQMLSQIKDIAVQKIVGDVHQLMLTDSCVDLIICRQVLHYCNLELAFRNIKHVLRKGGLVHIVQVVDFENVPESWDHEWASFRNVADRKHLRRKELEMCYIDNSFGVVKREYLKLRDQYSWNDFFAKHKVSKEREKEIKTFFEMTPKYIAQEIDLQIDESGIAYNRVFGFWLIEKH